MIASVNCYIISLGAFLCCILFKKLHYSIYFGSKSDKFKMFFYALRLQLLNKQTYFPLFSFLKNKKKINKNTDLRINSTSIF